MITNVFFLYPFSIGLLGLLTAGILFWINRGNLLASRLLAGVLTGTSVLIIGNALYLTSFFLAYPWLYRLISPLSFCIGPLSYLYVRTSLTQAYRLEKKDLLFFIPAILYLLHRIPFILLNAEEKRLVVENALRTTKFIAAEPEGWLPTGWAAIARIVVGMSFIVAQTSMLNKWKKRMMAVPQIIENNWENIRWLNWLTRVMLITYLVLLLEMFLHLLGNITLGFLIVFTIGLNILFITFYLFRKPAILYGITGWLPQQIEEKYEPSFSTERKNPKKPYINEGEGKLIRKKIELHFAEVSSYCRQGYSIRDLSIEIEIPVYQLSAFINQEYGKNFNELINDYRFQYLNKQERENKDFHLYTIEAIGKLAGFNSRTSFISAIKKRTGKTPSEYFSNLNISDSTTPLG
ncbi:MAG: AraC family transcriptional regulator [Sediminibacterium sp.]|nr:AraC family transcriptional regulator [Sediminibacterium sp.]